jgi:eukaryotic-like serine/threonine-protein kinase
MTPSAPRELSSSVASTTPRLTRGQIPATWTQPAEAVSVTPARTPRPFSTTAIVLGGIGVCVALAIVLVPRAGQPTPSTAALPPTSATPSGTPRPIEQVPEPTPTASSIPTGVAPEDQGGAERPIVDEKPNAALSRSAANAPVDADDDAGSGVESGLENGAESDGIVTELPARKKAKSLVWRAEKLLIDGEAVDAEPLLRRAAALDPTLPDAWRNLGIARATLGDTPGARNAYKRYLKLAPTAPDAGEVRKILAAAPDAP